MPGFRFQKPAAYKGASSFKIEAKLEAAKAAEHKAHEAFKVALSASLQSGDDWTAEVAAAETRWNKAKADVARWETALAEAIKHEAKEAAEQEEAAKDIKDARCIAAFEAAAIASVNMQAKALEYSEAYRHLAEAIAVANDERARNERVRSDLPTAQLPRLLAEDLARIHVRGTPFVPGLNAMAHNMRYSELRPLSEHYAGIAAIVRSWLASAKAARARKAQP